MAHRAKHRHTALLRRAAAGRQIKSDQTPDGQAAWKAAREALTKPSVKYYDEHMQLVP